MSETPRSDTKVAESDWFHMTNSGTDSSVRTRQSDVATLFSPAQDPGEIGRLGQYRILKPLGGGGMGLVFLAEDSQLKRLVAVKIVHPEWNAPEAKQRILQEAQALAAIRDERVVTIHQVGEDRDIIYLAMEFLPGQALDAWMEQNPKPSVEQILFIGRETALGLAAAHTLHLIHRDIKPANIWLEPRPEGQRPSQSGQFHPGFRVKLLDFGLARKTKESFKLTKPGSIMGTPQYIAPEQAQGSKPDVPSDIYSLGVVLYRLCTGRLPFPQEDLFSLMTALATQHPPEVGKLNPELPPALGELVMRMLAKNPAERPASAQSVADALEAISRGEEPILPPPSKPRYGNKGFRAWVSVAALAILPALIAVIGLHWYSNRDGSTRTEQTDKDRKLPTFASRGRAAVPPHLDGPTLPWEIVGHKSHPELLRESSAFLPSKRHPRIFWSITDAGNRSYLYAVDDTGRLRGVYIPEGSRNVDWESLGMDDQGFLYVGDTGNNLRGGPMKHRLIYKMREPDLPAVPPNDDADPVPVPLTSTHPFAFPDRPLDVEAIYYHQGHMYLIQRVRSLSRQVPTRLYRMPLDRPEEAVTLEPVCILQGVTDVTDASLSPDRRRLALSSSFGVYVFEIDPGKPMSQLGEMKPRYWVYPGREETDVEGCCWDGDALLLIAERTDEIYRMRIPPP